MLRGLWLATLVLSSPLTAQQAGRFPLTLAASVGFVHAGEDNGMQLPLGLFVNAGPVAIFLTPVDLAFVPADGDDRYERETLSNGNEICRDLETGQFAEKSKCSSTKTTYAASADVNLAFRTQTGRTYFVGGGYRAGNTPTPYGSLGFSFKPFRENTYFVRASAGQEFFQLSIGGTYRIQ